MAHRLPAACLCVALIVSTAPLAAQTTITLDDAQTYQTMNGWECTAYIASSCTPHFDAIRDTVLALAVDDVGINRVRLEVRSGAENDVDHYANWIGNGCPEPHGTSRISTRRSKPESTRRTMGIRFLWRAGLISNTTSR